MKRTVALVVASLFVLAIVGVVFKVDIAETGNFLKINALKNIFSKTSSKSQIITKSTNVQTAKAYSSMLSGTELNKENTFIAQVQDKAVQESLKYALNYKLNPREQFDADGNIVVKFKSGVYRTKLGYKEQKLEYESFKKSITEEWPELKYVKENVNKLYAEKVKNPKPLVSKTIPKKVKATKWLSKLTGLVPAIGTTADELNAINPDYHKFDYSPQGFIYYAADLYNQGVFPLLPYITPIRDQGYRGTCGSFSYGAKTEIILMDHRDLSEQYARYTGCPLEETETYCRATNISYVLESEWPYNPYHCGMDPANLSTGEFLVHGGASSHTFTGRTDSYYSELLGTEIPCTDTDHQGILVGGHYEPYPPVMESRQGNCVVHGGVPIGEEYRDNEALQRNITQFMALVINYLKYPIGINTGWIEVLPPDWEERGLGAPTAETIGEIIGAEAAIDGFITSDIVEFWGGSHYVAIVGYIPKEKIPESVKEQPSFIPDTGYFILKNSLGTEVGDHGFFYYPESVLQTRAGYGWTAVGMAKYNLASPDCPARSFAGVGPVG